jgi:hypothetical protein
MGLLAASASSQWPLKADFDGGSNFKAHSAEFLNPFFTLTRKSRVPGQTTCAEFDCLWIGTRGKGLRRWWGADVGTGQKA